MPTPTPLSTTTAATEFRRRYGSAPPAGQPGAAHCATCTCHPPAVHQDDDSAWLPDDDPVEPGMPLRVHRVPQAPYVLQALTPEEEAELPDDNPGT